MVIIPIIRHKIRHTLDRLPVYHRADTLTVKTNIQHSNLSGARGARGNHTNTQTVHREASAGQQVQTWYLLPERLNHHASSPYSKRNYSKSEHNLEHVFIPIRCWFSAIEQRLWMWSFFKTDGVYSSNSADDRVLSMRFEFLRLKTFDLSVLHQRNNHLRKGPLLSVNTAFVHVILWHLAVTWQIVQPVLVKGNSSSQKSTQTHLKAGRKQTLLVFH